MDRNIIYNVSFGTGIIHEVMRDNWAIKGYRKNNSMLAKKEWHHQAQISSFVTYYTWANRTTSGKNEQHKTWSWLYSHSDLWVNHPPNTWMVRTRLKSQRTMSYSAVPVLTDSLGKGWLIFLSIADHFISHGNCSNREPLLNNWGMNEFAKTLLCTVLKSWILAGQICDK